MTQTRAKHTRVGKYNYIKTVMCEQSDKIYRQCYTCKEYKPLDEKHFLNNERELMGFTFQCKECRNAYKKQRNQILKDEMQAKQLEEQPITKVEAKSLFDEKDSTETKLDKILSYLGLK